jgi:hypothetical protein
MKTISKNILTCKVLELTEYVLPKNIMSEKPLNSVKVGNLCTNNKNSFHPLLMKTWVIKIVNCNKILHRLWHSSLSLVDIGIIKLTIAFQINQFVKVIALAPIGYTPPGFRSI